MKPLPASANSRFERSRSAIAGLDGWAPEEDGIPSTTVCGARWKIIDSIAGAVHADEVVEYGIRSSRCPWFCFGTYMAGDGGATARLAP
jgi:hypothetical protein